MPNFIQKDQLKLRNSILDMMLMVQNQIQKTKKAVLFMDINQALEVFNIEKRVDAMELTIDRECEHLVALFNPVAADMRFVISMLKINSDLERIGDLADSISKFVVDNAPSSHHDLIMKLKIPKMFDVVISMFQDIVEACELDNSDCARKVFAKDLELNCLNTCATATFVEIMEIDSSNSKQKLSLYIATKRLERMGDHIKNIAENLIFYYEAKILKHSKSQNNL